MIARVHPLTTTRALRGPFDYRIASGQEVRVGSLLRVPLRSRSVLGVAVAITQRSELAPERLAEVQAVVGPGIGADLVALADWMAAEYCSTVSRALALMIAPGAGAGRGRKLALVAQLTQAGEAACTDPATDAVGGGGRPLSARQLELLRALERAGDMPAGELGTDALRRLEARGLVLIAARPVARRPTTHRVGTAPVLAPPLTDAQSAALAVIERALAGSEGDRAQGEGDRAQGEGYLLHGVTGSGKTEVYLGAAAAALAAGKSAIVLVPEIALTPQTASRFQARFGDVVAVLHSGLGAGQRHDEWLRLRSGEARICVGPRSAVFAPLDRIGLIVVDEEHEGSYKHEGDPRYDARTVAARRAQAHGAVLVLGSATPRPESVLSVRSLRLRERIDRRPLPEVQVLDMCGRHEPLHPETRMALADLRRADGKAIVLVNRRGWSNFLSCRSCGRVWLCPNCEVALVLHQRERLLACHHCGHSEPVPSRCGVCKSVSVARHGAGTERIEHDLREALGRDGFPIFRLDADVAALAQRAQTLARFAQAPAGVLVGTQMVAKGHDFPDVSLGLVLDADQTLRFPDFRAEERTFALITQLAGRTGRGALDGRVLVQTLDPDARAIAFAARHDSDGFVADELERRRALSYPPYASLVRIVCSADDEQPAREAAAAIRGRLDGLPGSVLGPAPLFRLRGRARSQVVVKSVARAAAIAAVGRSVADVAPGAARRGVSVSVDVDPQ
ncbi:MAG: replication restart helicase PriA [Solirubrobacteraceae bacterium]